MCFGAEVIVSDTLAMRATAGDYPAIFCSNLGDLKRAVIGITEAADREQSAKNARRRFSCQTFDQKIINVATLSN